MQHNLRGGKEWPACYGRSGNEVCGLNKLTLTFGRCYVVALIHWFMFFRKATDLFYSQQHVTAETLTPILFFVAAKKNGFACSGRSDNGLPQPILI